MLDQQVFAPFIAPIWRAAITSSFTHTQVSFLVLEHFQTLCCLNLHSMISRDLAPELVTECFEWIQVIGLTASQQLLAIVLTLKPQSLLVLPVLTYCRWFNWLWSCVLLTSALGYERYKALPFTEDCVRLSTESNWWGTLWLLMMSLHGCHLVQVIAQCRRQSPKLNTSQLLESVWQSVHCLCNC